MMQLNKNYNPQLNGSSLLLLNDHGDFEARAKVTKLVADQFPNIGKPTKERLVGIRFKGEQKLN
jgi:hypothetical protein